MGARPRVGSPGAGVDEHARRSAALAAARLAIVTSAFLAFGSAPAGAEQVRVPLEQFGSAEHPALVNPQALAVYQSSGDLLVADLGENEQQAVKFAGFSGGDTFTLGNLPASCSASATAAIAYSTTESTLSGNIQAALEAKCGANFQLIRLAAQTVFFQGAFAQAPQALLVCTKETGAGSCAVERLRAGGPRGLRRYHADGTPDNFSALGTNFIDGKGNGSGPGTTGIHPCAAPFPAECDETPLHGLFFTSADETQVAIDESAGPAHGDIYLTEPEKNQVSIFSSSGEYLGRLTAAKTLPFIEICGVAVDTAGAAYLAESNNGRVYQFVPSANPATNNDYVKPFFAAGLRGSPCNVALGAGPTAGSLFLSEHGSSAFDPGVVTKWDVASRTKRYAILPPAGTVDHHTLAFDPASGNLFLVDGSPGRDGPILEYDASGPSEANIVSLAKTTNIAGIAVRGSTNQLYVSRGFDGEGKVDVYGPPVTVPTPTTEAATEITPVKATLHGKVNPEGLAVTVCAFEYLTGAAVEKNQKEGHDVFAGAASKPCEGAIPADSQDHAVTVALTGLLPNTSYSFRLAAANANDNPGELNPGTKKELHTASPVETSPATAIAGAKATLNGAVFSANAPVTECLFQYGTTTAYGQTAPCQPEAAAIGADEAEHKVSAALTHLAPNGATYHFRLVASGVFGAKVPGADLSFKTANTVTTAPATEVGGHSATLNGTVNPESEAIESCLLEWGETTAYGKTAPCEAPSAAELSGESPLAVHAGIEGLEGNTTYHFRLAATYEGANTAKGTDQSFKTISPPQIVAEWATGVVLTEATLKAEINPEGFPTAYRIEWGETAAYGHATPEASVGSDSAPHTLTHFLEGLQPATTYHYRFLAESELGTTEGEDRTFTTYAAFSPDTECPNQAYRTGSGANLPDCRAYEMVSPPDKNGGGVGYSLGLIQASLDGDKLAYPSMSSFAGDLSNANFSKHYIAARGAAGWSTEAIDPSVETNNLVFDPLGVKAYFYAYTPDLSSAWFYNENEVPLTADAAPGYPDLYRRDNASGAYEALTVQPQLQEIGEPDFIELVGYSADLSDQFFRSPTALTPDASLTSPSIYDFSVGTLHLAGVLPDGSAPSQAVFAGRSRAQGNIESGPYATHNSVSRDGSRLFWVTGPNALKGNVKGTVYVRFNPSRPESASKDGAGNCVLEPDRACTVQLSHGGESSFLDATPDGSRVLLETGRALELVDVEGGALTPVVGELSQGNGYAANGGFHNGFLGASEDLSRLYFASEEALAPGATEGARNLYAYHEGDYTYIGELTDHDFPVGHGDPGNGVLPGPTGGEPEIHSSRVSPDGRHLAFTSSSASLAASVGYDNADATKGEAAREVYLYDAEADEGKGKLTCVSCNPSGARPLADHSIEEGIATFFDPPPAGPRAALLPVEGNATFHATRPLSPDGRRLFFNAYDALLPNDTNGTWDVYEWEAPGSGTCHEGDPDYFARNGGCLSLISTGQSPEPSQFFDADPSGKNAFIRTTGSIDPRDQGAYDAYDARIGGGFPLPTEAAACEGEACQAPPAPPDDPTPASSAFEGAGNVIEEAPAPTPCAKGKVRRHGRCVAKKHHKRVKRHQARHAGHNRGAPR